MMRILATISIYGTKASLERLISVAPILNGTLKQAGQSRKVPEADLWHYCSPWYEFHNESLNQEILNFLLSHARLGSALGQDDLEIKYATFTLCPVDQSYEETFSFLFTSDTLKALIQTGLSLEMAPASVMPAAAYWVKVKSSL